jgi:hypothetical protein
MNMNLSTGPGILGIAVFLITVTFMVIEVINLLPRFWGRKPKPAPAPITRAATQPALSATTRSPGYETDDPYAYMKLRAGSTE